MTKEPSNDIEAKSGPAQLQDWPAVHPSFSLRKILVPLDFSGRSLKAAIYAVALAQAFNAEIIFLHAVHPYPVSPDAPGLMGDYQEKIVQEGRLGLEKLASKISNANCRAVVRVGIPAAEIVAAAREELIDLIIIGTHGRGGVAHAFLGSVAERVARQASCPVLVVRDQEHDFVAPAAPTFQRNTA